MTPFARRLLLVVSLVLHLGIGVFYLAAGLVAPGWAVLLLWAAWVAMLVLLVRLWRVAPQRALLVPVAAVLLIYLVITLGEQLLGWTA